MAGRYGNGGARKLQKVCEEFDAGLVGATFDGWSSECEFERVTDLAGDGVPLSARMNFDGEGSAGWGVVDGDHKKRITTEGTEVQRGLQA